MLLSGYKAVRNFLIRSRPRVSSFFDVAYETRICSRVPNPSPGTVATWASRSNFPARSEAELTPPRPRRRRCSDRHRRRLRERTLHPGNCAQTIHHMVAELNIFLAHISHTLLGAVQGRDCGLLYDRSWVRGGLALQFLHGARTQRLGARA